MKHTAELAGAQQKAARPEKTAAAGQKS